MRSIVLVSLLLSACGVADVATATATTAKLQAEQARQGKDTTGKVRSDLDAAAKGAQQRLETADPDK